jgi:hypothetical protein
MERKTGLLQIIFSLTASILLLPSFAVASSEQPSISFAKESCTSHEKWTWKMDSEALNQKKWVSEFEDFLSGKSTVIRGFSEALALRRLATQDSERAFSEYWMSRALYQAGLIHLAQRGFNSLLTREPASNILGFQIASLGCISQIRKSYPAIDIDDKVARQLSPYLSNLQSLPLESSILKPVVWEAAFFIAIDPSHPSFNHMQLVLKNAGAYEHFSAAVMSASRNKHLETIKNLDLFFTSAQQGGVFFKSYFNQAYLLYGRALYTLGRFTEAAQKYKLIHVRSNEWVHGLSELSWAYLLDGKYRESIGAGIGLQSGNLKNTFAPESLMVMAIALNEICQFPESMNVIQSFRKTYKDSYQWLNEQTSEKATHKDYYKLAVAYAKKAPNLAAPPIVASEWIRSPVFLSSQERINLIFKEKALIDQLSAQGKAEQKNLTLKLLADAKALEAKFRLAKIKLGENDRLPDSLLRNLEDLRERFIHFRRIKKAAPVWRTVLSHYQNAVPSIQTKMVNGISREISRLNLRMFAQLEEIAENNELIEVEIFNGASEDIIWQNAHPDFKEVSKKLKAEGSGGIAAEKVWDWGTTSGGFDGRAEIWEDEVGSLSANLFDNCENKDKYLAVKKRSR